LNSMRFALPEGWGRDSLIQLSGRAALIKCPVCGAEIGYDTPFCPICGAMLSFSFRPLIAGLIHLAICLAALHFIPAPYAYIPAVLFGVLALLSLGAATLGLYRALRRWVGA
jgi:hypothetical protein